MRHEMADDAEYRFLALPGASVEARLEPAVPELQLFGNRAGVLSLANVLLWLVTNAWRRELLSLAELPFVRVEPPLAVCLRVTAEEATGRDGLLSRNDRGQQPEWELAEDDLERVALQIHRLAC